MNTGQLRAELVGLPATGIMAAIRPVPGPRASAEPTTGELAALDQAAAAAVAAARDDARPHRPEHLAPATSPVGRANADPALADPLRRLATRLGRPLADLSECTDAELHAITGALLAEKHRRASRWFDTA